MQDNLDLKGIILSEKSEPEKVTYSSSDTEVFTVDENGYVKGVKEGTAVLTAKVEDLVATTTIIVEEKPVTGLSIQEGMSIKEAEHHP